MSLVGVIDYGMGNLYSVQKALQHLGVSNELVQEPYALGHYEKLILPGVGAFGDAMRNLQNAGMAAPIRQAVANGTPLLGICLGMQVLFSDGEEMGHHTGLGLLKGAVRCLQVSAKVPHMGWNQIKIRRQIPLLSDLPGELFVYFANSFVVYPEEEQVIAGETEYETMFPSVVSYHNVHGVQFHPEKSQRVGLKILQNFVEKC